MSQFFANVSSTALREQLEKSGFKKPKNTLNALDLIPKDTLTAILLDICQSFQNQTEISKLTEYFVKYATTKYEFTYQSNRFAWSFEYSLDIHAKIYQEPKIFQYFFKDEKPRDIINLYLRARRILLQHFVGDFQNKFYDLEPYELDLDHWVVITNRIFDDKQYSKTLESLNYAIVQESSHSNDRFLKKTINSIIYIQLLILEHLKLREEKKAAGDTGISPNKNVKQSGPPNLGIGKSEVAGYVKIGGNMILNDSSTKQFSPQRNSSQKQPDMIYKTPIKSSTMIDGSPDFSKMRSISPMKGAVPTTKELYDLKKEKKFLNTELYTQTREKKKVQENLDKAIESYTDLSTKHDKLIDFVRELQVNFLHLTEHLQNKNSDIVKDPKLKQAITRVSEYKNFEKNHADRLIPLGLLNKKETFGNLLENAKQKQPSK